MISLKYTSASRKRVTHKGERRLRDTKLEFLFESFQIIFQNFQKLFENLQDLDKELQGDLGESFPTSIYLQKSASIPPRTSPK